MRDCFFLILSLPKTIYFNFKYFNFKQAMKLPILMSYNTVLLSTKGKITINRPIKTAMIRIGFGNVGIFDKSKSRTILNIYGEIIFNGRADIGHGSRISINAVGKLILGDNFKISAESSIICREKITFGDNCLLSWDILIMDTDFHKITHNGKYTNKNKKISIGEHVWIGCRCTILKGVTIANDTVISANSHIYKSFDSQNILIGGNPAKIIKEDINWLE